MKPLRWPDPTENKPASVPWNTAVSVTCGKIGNSFCMFSPLQPDQSSDQQWIDNGLTIATIYNNLRKHEALGSPVMGLGHSLSNILKGSFKGRFSMVFWPEPLLKSFHWDNHWYPLGRLGRSAQVGFWGFFMVFPCFSWPALCSKTRGGSKSGLVLHRLFWPGIYGGRLAWWLCDDCVQQDCEHQWTLKTIYYSIVVRQLTASHAKATRIFLCSRMSPQLIHGMC